MRALATIAAAALAVLAVRTQVAVVTVSGVSMQPTYQHGDRLLMRRARAAQLRAGDVVVVERPAAGGRWRTPPPRWPGRGCNWMIKRVVAVPGDPVPDLTHPSPLTPPLRVTLPDDRVPAAKFLIVGDNPDGSFDSRVFGYCPAGALLGVVVCSRRAAGSPCLIFSRI